MTGWMETPAAVAWIAALWRIVRRKRNDLLRLD
jgi:hypothetical protein